MQAHSSGTPTELVHDETILGARDNKTWTVERDDSLWLIRKVAQELDLLLPFVYEDHIAHCKVLWLMSFTTAEHLSHYNFNPIYSWPVVLVLHRQ